MKIKKNHEITLLFILLSVALITIIYFKKTSSKNSPKANPDKTIQVNQIKNIKTGKAKSGYIGTEYIAGGEVVPLDSVVHICKQGGTVKKIYVKNGVYVKKGQILLTIKNKDILSSYVNAKSNLKNAKENYRAIKFEFNGKKLLFKKRLMAESKFLEFKNQYISAKNNLLSTEASLNAAKKEYSDLTVKSKISGYVSGLNLINKNELSKNEKLCTINNLKKMGVIVGVSSQNISLIDKNSKIEISIPVINKKYKGKTIYVNPVADNETRLFDVKIEILGRAKNVKRGMYSQVKMILKKHKGIMVPEKSVIIEALGSFVFVVKDNIVHKTSIKIGTKVGKYIEVIGKKIKANDKVVVDGQFLLNDKDKVKEIKISSGSN